MTTTPTLLMFLKSKTASLSLSLSRPTLVTGVLSRRPSTAHAQGWEREGKKERKKEDSSSSFFFLYVVFDDSKSPTDTSSQRRPRSPKRKNVFFVWAYRSSRRGALRGIVGGVVHGL